MNPEFQRNLWLELTPRRVILMVVVLGLVFLAASLSAEKEWSVLGAAHALFYVIVVLWGTRNAATAVAGEIRDRTWDMQLLSAIGPGAMTWGKLFGATIYNWFGGAICLGVIVGEMAMGQGVVPALIDLAYCLTVGVISQAAALLASLVAVRRRQTHSRLDVFIYQIVGILAGSLVSWVWSAADPAGSILFHRPPLGSVEWWGQSFDTRVFLLVSLAIFAGWTLLACYREMRLELKLNNGSLVWFCFLVFIGIYAAGFDGWQINGVRFGTVAMTTMRLGAAAAAYIVLTYVMVILEPKDRVHYRWLGSQLAAGRLGAFVNGLEGWMMSYAASLLAIAAFIVSMRMADPQTVKPLVEAAAVAGFLTRDVAIFVLMRSLPGRRRGDLAAIVILIALYLLAPLIVEGLGLGNAIVLFLPKATELAWIGPLVAWAEGLALAVFAISRVSIRRSPADRSAPSPAS
jgi:hypothetical protein